MRHRMKKKKNKRVATCFHFLEACAALHREVSDVHLSESSTTRSAEAGSARLPRASLHLFDELLCHLELCEDLFGAFVGQFSKSFDGFCCRCLVALRSRLSLMIDTHTHTCTHTHTHTTGFNRKGTCHEGPTVVTWSFRSSVRTTSMLRSSRGRSESRSCQQRLRQRHALQTLSLIHI